MEVRYIKKKDGDKEYKPPSTHPDLPQLHFAMCIIGPRNRGKSLLIRNLLLRDEMLKKTFKKPNYIVITCPNLDVNGDYDEVSDPPKAKKKHIYKLDTYSHEMVNNLIATQKQLIEEYGRKKAPEILIVLDDIIDSHALDHHSAIEKLFSRGRHININVITVSQQMKRISRLMRLNSDYIAFFMPNNFGELQDFLEEFVPKNYHYGMAEYLKKMWERSIYNFVLVDFRTSQANRRYRENFDKPIILEDLPTKKSAARYKNERADLRANPDPTN